MTVIGPHLVFPWSQWDPWGGKYSERGSKPLALIVPAVIALSIKMFAFAFQECFSK